MVSGRSRRLYDFYGEVNCRYFRVCFEVVEYDS